MQNFKVGDWVKSTKYPHLKPIQIESTYESNERKGELGLKSGGTVLYSSEAVHWKPKVGEWCWFLNNNREPILKQFLQMCPIVPTNYVSKQGTISGSVEPFIGELPTYLKDNT